MANPELGVKRTCPETGRNFYDLNKDPIISPYTGREYPLTFFEIEAEQKKSGVEDDKTSMAEEKNFDIDETDDAGPEIIPLSEVEEGENENIDNDEEVISNIPDIDISDDGVKLEDNAFIEEDAEDSDLSNVIGAQNNDDKDET